MLQQVTPSSFAFMHGNRVIDSSVSSVGYRLCNIGYVDMYLCADQQRMRMFCMLYLAGLLKAYAAAAQAVVSFLSNNPQLPRASQTAAALHVQLMGKSAHMLASAGNAMLLLWNSLMLLMPTTQLLSAQSLLLDSALPTATLAMALARAYASDEVFCGTVMWQVLGASCTLAAAAASGKAGRPAPRSGQECHDSGRQTCAFVQA